MRMLDGLATLSESGAADVRPAQEESMTERAFSCPTARSAAARGVFSLRTPKVSHTTLLDALFARDATY